MTCITEVNAVIITREREEECGWIDELKKLVERGKGDCKQALQGLRILRYYIALHQLYTFYNKAEKKLTAAIREGKCVE